jgi:hypothetical protein
MFAGSARGCCSWDSVTVGYRVGGLAGQGLGICTVGGNGAGSCGPVTVMEPGQGAEHR